MLNLVTGPSGCGKTEYIRGVLGTLAAEGQDKLLLIVPEQYSYDSERAMLETFGNQTAQRVEVVTFSRLADYVFRTTGGNAGIVADDGTRLILMLRAMDAVADKLDYYEKYRDDVRLAKELIAVFREVRQSGAGLLKLEEAAVNVRSTVLSKKLKELFLIFEMYDAMFRQRYSDEDLQIEKLCRVLDDTQFLRGYTLAIDGFKSFTGQELELLGRILSQAEDVYVTLCTVGTNAEDKTSSSMIFASVDETKRRLKKMAQERNVRVFEQNEKQIDLLRGRRFLAPELKFLEENLFVPQKTVYDGFAENITICAGQTIFDECEYIVATIRKLLREEGLRARDIAVIVRREDEYRKELENAFRRYGIPFFDDARQPVEHQPLVVLVRAVLALLSRGFTSENLLQYLKTGLAGVGPREVAELENYVFIWDVKGSAWKDPFSWNPFGLDAAYRSREEVEESLGLLNHTREQVIGPLLRLKKETKEKSFREVGEAIYHFLDRTKVPEHLKTYALSLDDAGLPDLAGEQDRVWDLVISVIDRLTAVYGDEPCRDLKVYSDLFDAILSMTDLGNIPQGLDEVRLSAADRVRLSSPNTVFVAGLEEGVFPAVIGSSGLFTLHERADLRENGLELSFPENLRASEERFITYSAVTAPKQRLYLSWHRLSLSGDSYLPSELIAAVERLFTVYDKDGKPQEKRYRAEDTETLGLDYYAETLSAAYQTYAKQIRSEDRATLSAVREAITGLDEDGTYQKKLASLDTVLRPRPFRIEDPSIATELFRKDMNLSASRVDNYYHCAFQYFCRYGLNAEPRKRATLGANHYGTIIHYVLEQLLKETDKASFVAYSQEELRARVDHWLKVFAEQDLGGLSDKTTRFQYLYNRLTLTLYEVAERLQEELKVSDFVPSDFELPIGNGEEVPSYTLDLPDGGTLAVRGSVDRVDLYEHDGKTYVRVVDYKSGGKEFELSDILYGLNLQMLLYLFTIEQNGTGKYDDIVPAGILYYPAKRQTGTVAGRDAPADTVDRNDQAKDRENGLFLRDEDILEAMENGLEGRFLPVKRKKDGFTSEKSLASLSELGQLRRRIDFLLQKMATELHEGDIAAVPALQNEQYLPCDYCDYRSVCRQDEPEARVIEKFTDREELMARMNGEEVEAHAE